VAVFSLLFSMLCVFAVKVPSEQQISKKANPNHKFN